MYHVIVTNTAPNTAKLVIIFLWFIVSLVTEPFIAAVIIKNLNKNIYNVNDILFTLLPYVGIVYDYYSTPLLVIFMILIIISICKSKICKYNIILTIANVFHMRNISIIATTLPLIRHDIDDMRCVQYSELPYMKILEHTSSGFECSDYFFSGHTVFYTLGLISVFSLINNKLVLAFSSIVYISCLVSLLIARVHYTIDIIFGVYLTLTMYYWISPNIIKWMNRHNSSQITINTTGV